MGLGLPDAGSEQGYAEQIMSMIEDLPTVILVRNASRFQGRLI